MCVVNCGYHGNSYSFQHSEKSALFDRLCTPVRCPTTESFLCGRSSKTYILASLSGERCSGGQLLSTFSDLAGGLSGLDFKYKMLTCERCQTVKAHAAMLEILYLCQARSLSQLKRHCVFFFLLRPLRERETHTQQVSYLRFFFIFS